MASSSVSQEDHDAEHDFALASRRARVRSARANRTVNNALTQRGEEGEGDERDSNIPKFEQASVVLVEQNDASPKPICRGLNKDKRPVARGGHSGKTNKGVRDRRKLREKRRSTGVMHLPSTESTGGSTGEDENNENSAPVPAAAPPVPPNLPGKPTTANVVSDKIEEKNEKIVTNRQGKSESDLDADDEANNSGDVRTANGEQRCIVALRVDNGRLADTLETKDKRIAALEMQVSQLARQLSEMREENAKLHRLLTPQ